jgi:hypothetical protein
MYESNQDQNEQNLLVFEIPDAVLESAATMKRRILLLSGCAPLCIFVLGLRPYDAVSLIQSEMPNANRNV